MFARVGRTAGIALGFMIFGFAMIFFAWLGAARLDYAQGQIPYLISGGVGGLALISIGAGLLIFEAGRRGVARLEAKLEELSGVVHGGGSGAPAADTPKPEPQVVASNGLMVVGRTSFHRPDCRLVQGKEDLDYAGADEAAERGLQPCRVCDPLNELTAVRKK